ncbi:type II secretion system protein [Candidatus Peregrinibacteria bacterium]|jgi:prepilin-type N-terminal cleavage/methylation domain-containing protein|nr:type II secretion system protein [Candidatus Peregrinibacteria bacterium]MBT4631492.1 type II secretion system protein [Candidatus Peregrinibacteria bacterium]MBT5823881.1 type II secretion system protein [Candidatus Peregrinibacteria bacterium]
MKNLLLARRGFTLVELLIVITIIGILSVALVPRLIGGSEKARNAARRADLQQIATAVEFFADDGGGVYPASSDDTDCVSTLAIDPYLTTIPADPLGSHDWSDAGTSDDCALLGGYEYSVTSDGFLLFAELEGETNAGQGVYDAAADIDPLDTTSNNLDALSACAVVGDCTTAVYVIAR